MDTTWLWLGALAAAALAALGFRRYAGLVIRVHSRSMLPTLRAGQLLFARPLRDPGQLRHGDIVVLQSEELNERIIKRLAGLPGDRLAIDAQGLQRNGQRVDEPHVAHHGGRTGRWQVPSGHCFVLGDNRAASSDSRNWQAPYVPLHAIVGIVRGRSAVGLRND
ncbi:MAG: hypothetical protein RL244_1995 [Pseudomonadota bacterium]|jgi:signal peptidase I